MLRVSLIGSLTLAATLLFAVPALAAPTFKVELTRTPTVIHRNDEWSSYEIKVKNTSPVETASGQLNVFINLPEGMTFLPNAKYEGGWSCDPVASICSNALAVVPPGTYYPTLVLQQVVIDESAPLTPTVSVVAVGAGATTGAVAKDTFTFAPAVPFGLESISAGVKDEAGVDFTQAGGHPYEASASFAASKHTCAEGPKLKDNIMEQCWLLVDQLKEGFAELPPGLIGSPAAVDACTAAELERKECPESASVGGVGLWFDEKHVSSFGGVYPVFQLVPEKGFAAEFGFKTLAPSFTVRFRVRSNGDYGLTGVAPLIPQNPTLFASDFTFCSFGVKKFGSLSFPLGPTVPGFKGCRKMSEALPLAKPVVTMPTNCSTEPVFKFAASTWKHAGAKLPNGYADYSDPNWQVYETPQPAFTGCDKLVDAWTDPATSPSLDLQPDVTQADTPAGYTAKVHIHNEGLEELDGLGASHLRNIEVRLPEGVSFNPSVGDGIQTCSEAQMGRLPGPGIHYDFELPKCPSTAKLGVAKIDTPILENPLKGGIYLAAQHENPFNSDYAVYLVVEEPDAGLVFKLPGEVTADPVTGQIVSTFKENPQLPFEDLRIDFFGGPVAALANPGHCGDFATSTDLTPWAAEDPYNPKPEEIARFVSPFHIGESPDGGPCANSPAERPFNLGMVAGTETPQAGIASPFTLDITRPDGSQELQSMELTTPPGFSASLKGIPYCSDAAIESARARTGVAETASPSCPAASHLGTIYAGAGAGSRPLYSPGDIYLAGPYKGAPLSVINIVPGIAGGTPGHPAFDLGNVVVRAALHVNRANAQVTAKTDPIPRVLKGVVLRIRDIRINLDRKDWTRNPTSCDASATTVKAFGNSGAVTEVGNRFQVGNCDALGFKPKVTAKVIGGTKRNSHPAFKAEVTYPEGPGYANLKDVQVALPHSEFLDQSHINTVCTRTQAASQTCPQGSIYGFAEATTPLLDGVLKGPVFLKSSVNKLPDLAIFLKGPDNQPIEVEFQGRIDSVHGQIRNTIEGLPDVPVSKFVLSMKGGNKGLLVNSRDLCKGRPGRMTVRTIGHNNKRFDSRPKLGNSCGKKTKKAKKKNTASKSQRLSGLVAFW